MRLSWNESTRPAHGYRPWAPKPRTLTAQHLTDQRLVLLTQGKCAECVGLPAGRKTPGSTRGVPDKGEAPVGVCAEARVPLYTYV